METKINYTTEIFAALGITPETQPWAYYVDDGERVWNLDEFLMWYSMNDADYYPYSLLSGTLEANGLAVELLSIATKYVDFIQIFPCDSIRYEEKYVGSWCVDWNADTDCYKIRKSFAHAVHDALVEALGIGDKKDA